MGVENRFPGYMALSRSFLSWTTSPIFPAEVINIGNGLKRAGELQETEGRNLIVMSTHPSATDQPREYPIIWRLPEFQNAVFHVPTASHIFNGSRLYNLSLRALSKICGINIYPIATSDTVKKHKNLEDKKGFGNYRYFKTMKRVLSDCADNHSTAVVFLTPSAGVRTSLNIQTTKAAELLLTAGGGNNLVLLMGVEINNVKQYSEKTSGMNLFKKYTIRIGDAYTDQELLEILSDYRQSEGLPEGRKNRPFAYLDHWLFNEAFVPLVPMRYRCPSFSNLLTNL